MRTAITAVLVAAFLIPLSVCGQQGNQALKIGLHQAALQGNIDAVNQQIKAGSDLNQKDTYGSTPLIIAATFGKTEVARALINAGADMSIGDNYGSTPLHIAALFGRTEIVRDLLSKGADQYIRNNNGATAFDIAAPPFDYDKGLYDQLAAALGPAGLKLDYEQIKKARPRIAEMLRPKPEELTTIDYHPLPSTDWRISTPQEQGLNPNLISELYLDASHMQTLYSLLVVKNGYLIAEGYFNEGSVEQKARLQSVTKSVTSALVGIAQDQGYLSSTDQKMIDFFPEISDQITDPRKKQITIRHLLQMRAGYPWEETDTTLWKGLLSGNYPPLIEEFPLIADPGTSYNYSNLSSNWLGIILARATKTNLKSYADKNLFQPLGTEAGEWGTDADGNNNGCADLHLAARDMAKFGLLYLNNGKYQGKQIVPANWVKESLQSYSKDAWAADAVNKPNKVGRYFRDLGYGYQWWSATVDGRPFDFAWGHGGQLIVLLHDIDMVIVVTSKPFYIQHTPEAWKHEQANINMVGKFIQSLPKE